jgi:hypothetical protein
MAKGLLQVRDFGMELKFTNLLSQDLTDPKVLTITVWQNLAHHTPLKIFD